MLQNSNIIFYLSCANIEVKLTPKLIKTMISLHPNFLNQNGQKFFAVLPYEEYLLIKEILEDIEDLNDLRQAKAADKDAPTLTLETVKKQLQREKQG